MTDTYTRLIRTTPGRFLAKRAGLPNPPRLPRRADRAEAVLGPAVVLGASAGAEEITQLLLSWGADVRRRFDGLSRVGTVVVVLDEIDHPGQIGEIVLPLAGAMRSLAPGARIVTISRPATGSGEDVAREAARGGVEGLLRSLGHEVRRGATANGILAADGVALSAPGVQGALRFLLSAASAFVDGQLVRVDSEIGTLPEYWDRPLEGRTALITGAARGIGAAIAKTFAGLGARLVVLDVPGAGSDLAKVANELRAIPLQLDVTAADAPQRVIAFLRERGIVLDALVLNAGITRDKLFANMTPDRWDPVIAVNIASQIALADALLADSEAASEESPSVVSPELRIVSLASTSGIAGNRGQTNYATSKAGVVALVAALADRLEGTGMTANAVAPGFIETEMTAKIPPVQREIARRVNSLQQGGLPLDVAETIAFLASAPAGGLRGETIRVCGQNIVGK